MVRSVTVWVVLDCLFSPMCGAWHRPAWEINVGDWPMMQPIHLTDEQRPAFHRQQRDRLRLNLRVSLVAGAAVSLFFLPWSRWHDRGDQLPTEAIGLILAFGLLALLALTYYGPLVGREDVVTIIGSLYTLSMVSYLLVILPNGFLFGAGLLVSYTVVVTVLAVDLSPGVVIWCAVMYFVVPNTALLLDTAPRLTILSTNWILISGGVLAFGLALLLDQSHRRAYLLELELAEEKRRSDDLLFALLPSAVAEELKRTTSYAASVEPNATVLFADVVGFTALSRQISPQELIALLTDIFTGLDELAAELGLEKIKTIGDAYMVAAGVADGAGSNEQHVADFGLAAIGVVRHCSELHGHPLEIRVGIAQGPVVCGVIGRRKPHFDLWGATVNLASRLESTAPTGGVQVDTTTANLLRDSFIVEPRGLVDLPGFGMVETCLLLDRRGGHSPQTLARSSDSPKRSE